MYQQLRKFINVIVSQQQLTNI